MRKSDFYLGVLDLAQGTIARKYFNFFLESLQWNRKEILQCQVKKLKELIRYSYRHVKYYREIFEKNNLNPDSIKTLEDLKQLPVLTRSDIQKNFEKLVSDEKEMLKYTRSSSSGTTGIPINYLHDVDGDSSGKAAGFFFNYLSGWNFGRRSIHIWGNITSIQRWNSPGSKLKQFFFMQKNLPSTDLNEIVNYKKVIDLINRIKPFSIDGYTSSIYNLARYIKDHNVKIYRPKFVFTTAENLFKNEKNIIESSLGLVSDIYGCGEINGIAVRPVAEDKYYILEPHVIIEAESIRKGDYKEIIVTNLDNKIMPLIRYKIGDLIDGIYEGDEQNRFGFSYFKQIIGRTSEVIDMGNGKILSPINIFGGTLFREIGGVLKHKVVWNGNYLDFLFEVNPGFNREKACEKINAELKPYDVTFKITIVDRLNPDKSGKFRYMEIAK